MRPNLSEEQVTGATTRRPRAFIEAGPGAGKTTVAAVRFGVLRFCRPTSAVRGVVALSFTQAATHELHTRIVDRWGPRALDGTSRASTIDAELVKVLCHLLRTGQLRWPGAHTDLDPIDSWNAHPKYKWLPKPQWGCYVPGLAGRDIVPQRVVGPQQGFTKTDLLTELSAGECTHDDIRRVIATALNDPQLRVRVASHRRETVSHLIIDEVFDADELDLDLIRLHCEANIPVTVIGDRWQALYEFRNARPELVRKPSTTSGSSHSLCWNPTASSHPKPSNLRPHYAAAASSQSQRSHR